jgi:hypothetical protein
VAVDGSSIDAGNPADAAVLECRRIFDCYLSAVPACDPDTMMCVAGFSMCTGDDTAEDADDGPINGTVLAPSVGTPDTVLASICSMPAAEADWYKFTVAEGDDRLIVLDWAGTEDLDIVLTDIGGLVVDTAFVDQPEVIDAADLAAGDYYIAISQFAPEATAAAADYSLTLSIPECDTSFDCLTAGSPVCGQTTRVCEAGSDLCTGDDGNENGDDGPIGATDVTPALAGNTVTSSKICTLPATEADFFVVTVANGEGLDITVDWTDVNADLDVTLFNSAGEGLGFTFWAKPEVVTLTNLAAGDYYIQVVNFGAPVAAAVDYTLTVGRTAGGCTTVADCATEFETQFFRGSCNVGTGACESIDGAGALAANATCDSPDDCASGFCSYSLFESDAAASVCTVSCSTDANCGAITGTSCTVPFQVNTCHPDCVVDTDCGANPGSGTLDPGLPWDYLTCNAGVCEL